MLFGLATYSVVTGSPQILGDLRPQAWLNHIFDCLEACEDVDERMASVEVLQLLCAGVTSQMNQNQGGSTLPGA